MNWMIQYDPAMNNRVVGIFPSNYTGAIPAENIIEVTQSVRNTICLGLKQGDMRYDEKSKTFEPMPQSTPTFSELKAQKKQEIAAARYEAETAGVTVNGVLIDTGRDSQALITGAALSAMLDGEYSLNWKTPTGFVHLTSPEIIAVAQAVRAHVQACFDREGELVALVDAAQTAEDLDEIIISWPV